MPHTPADILTEYAAAIDSLDVEAFVGLYDEGALVFDAFDRWAFRGTAEWRPWVQAWFGEMPQGGGARFENVTVFENGGVAALAADVAYFSLNDDSSPGDEMVIRYTANLGRDSSDGRWRILMEHTSIPLDAETMTPAFRP